MYICVCDQLAGALTSSVVFKDASVDSDFAALYDDEEEDYEAVVSVCVCLCV
jgi:hypothetical protein